MPTMPATASLESASRGVRPLAWSLVAGAAYDFLFALLMLLAPGLVARQLALPLPGEPFYLRVLAALLAIAGAVYLVAARDPLRNRQLVAIAIVGRFAGFLALGGSALGRPELAGLWLPAAGDLGFALLHLATAGPLRR
jgi:hypothetical protein